MTTTNWCFILIVGALTGCTYVEISENLEKISHNNKSWSSRIKTLDETPSRYRLQTTKPDMRLMKRKRKLELN